MEAVRLGLIGLGTVGCGVANVLQRNYNDIVRRAGRDIIIKTAAVRDATKTRPLDTQNFSITTDVDSLLSDPDIDIIVELAGGEELAEQYVHQAILQGKHVVTANKALIAKCGNAIFHEAHNKGVMVAFEAAVAGGIPIIKAMREGMAGNKVELIAGIINGTCNYILTTMLSSGVDFETCLQQAQDAGYAEADPSFDIDGIDAAHKLTILASLAFGIPLQFDKVFVEGIRDIQLQDIAYAQELGYGIKHLAIAKHTANGIECRVHPTLIPLSETLSHVNGVMNAVYVVGDAVGPTLFYGAGAGMYPTASAVVADIVEVVRTLTSDPKQRVPHLAFQPDSLQQTPILPMGDSETAYYLRLMATDKPGVLADVTRILGKENISIESILQKERDRIDNVIPVVIITHRVSEATMDNAIKQITALEDIHSDVIRLRLENLQNGGLR